MNIPFKLICIVVLIQSECSPVSSKNTSGDADCNHPSKKDFGLVKNGFVRESFRTLPKIIAGFLLINNSDPIEDDENITLSINDCIRSEDCRIYTMLDKKKENSLTLCVVVNETKNCFVSTCTCPSSRIRRGVSSHLLTRSPSSGSQEAKCKLELILSENVSDNCQRKMINLRGERTENPIECTTLKCETKKNTMKNKEKKGKSHMELNLESKVIFGTGDKLQAVTLTANSSFVRAAQPQGVSFAVHLHPSRALTEEKEKNAIPLSRDK